MISKMNTQMSWHHNQQTKTKTARRNASEPCRPRIDISVTFLDGRVFGIKFEPSATVARVIRRAARRVGVSPNELRLYLRTDRLEATQLLFECGIEDGATLHAVIRDVVPLVVRSAYGERRTICVESSDALEETMSQACAAFRLPLSQQQHMRLVDRGRVLAVGTFRTLLGLGVGAGSELMLTSETVTSIDDYRSNLEDRQSNSYDPDDHDLLPSGEISEGCVHCAALGAQCSVCAYYELCPPRCAVEWSPQQNLEDRQSNPNWLRLPLVGSGWGKEHSSGDSAKDDDDPIYERWRARS